MITSFPYFSRTNTPGDYFLISIFNTRMYQMCIERSNLLNLFSTLFGYIYTRFVFNNKIRRIELFLKIRAPIFFIYNHPLGE